jgi:hypothetical protein
VQHTSTSARARVNTLSIGSMQQCPDTAGTRVGRAYTTRTAGIQAWVCWYLSADGSSDISLRDTGRDYICPHREHSKRVDFKHHRTTGWGAVPPTPLLIMMMMTG